jgi:hypothetical protein
MSFNKLELESKEGQPLYPVTDVSLIENLKQTIIDMIYPIGSIYIGVADMNPDITFGGQWVKWGGGTSTC